MTTYAKNAKDLFDAHEGPKVFVPVGCYFGMRFDGVGVFVECLSIPDGKHWKST